MKFINCISIIEYYTTERESNLLDTPQEYTEYSSHNNKTMSNPSHNPKHHLREEDSNGTQDGPKSTVPIKRSKLVGSSNLVSPNFT